MSPTATRFKPPGGGPTGMLATLLRLLRASRLLVRPLTIAAAPGAALAQAPAAMTSFLRALPPQAQKKNLRRYLHFYEPRAFPNSRIPAAALGRARRDHERKFGPLRAPQPLPGPHQPAPMDWVPIGPAPAPEAPTSGGPITAVAVDPRNAEVIYIGAAAGGVWKTVNGGLSWRPLTDFECATAVTSIAVDPINTAIVYVGTGERGLAGDSYQGCGLLKSSDGGLTWTRIGAALFDGPDGVASIAAIAVHPAVSNVVLVASDLGLFRTADAGATFTQVRAGPASDVAFDPSNPTIAFAAIGRVFGDSRNGIYKSKDAGASFDEHLRKGFPSANAGRIRIGIAPSDTRVLYAAVQSSRNANFGELAGLYKTVDGGANWMRVGATGASCHFQCWYSMVLTVDPANSETVFFGAANLYKSTDGGASFLDATRTIHSDQQALVLLPGSMTTMLAGTDGGIFKSSDGGEFWISLNSNLELTEFNAGLSLHPTDPNIALGGTQGGHTLQFMGADTWMRMPFEGLGGCDGGPTVIAEALYAQCEWQAGAVHSGPRRFGELFFVRKVEGIRISDDGLFYPPLVGSPSMPRTLYFGLARLYKTTDGAERWSPLAALGGNITAIAEAPSEANVVYAGTLAGAVRVSANGGVSFAAQGAGLPARVPTGFAVHPGDSRAAYVVFSGFGSGHVFKTTNRGASWTDISGNLPDVPVNAIVIDPAAPAERFLIGTDLGVYRTDDGGATWRPFNSGLPNVPVRDLVYNARTGMLVVATAGRGAFKTAIPGMGTRGAQ
ncbi:MAG: hypothetical protein IT536_15145 [Hyphomicrobiales bacterium]|nr:hypothetical protein [Hyphomicrobiales bacterium]